ncbi:hypothetical protein RR46_01383 [Papilio xuthus]|uniref:Uncharacterized protein n=1 Tax=Papilio xuthus TaxID=66420 RepID=A0A0N0P9S9_PAPXU|nr:hypothetical protein RR46_01383 [Papilio xuthus]
MHNAAAAGDAEGESSTRDATRVCQRVRQRRRFMKRSKSYTWLSGLLRPRDPPSDPLRDPPHDPPPPAEEWGAAAWVHADATQPASRTNLDHVVSGCGVAVTAVMLAINTKIDSGGALHIVLEIELCDHRTARTAPHAPHRSAAYFAALFADRCAAPSQ